MTKNKKFSFFGIMSEFDKVGFSFYEYGSLKRDGKKIATYYKGGKLSDDMKEKLMVSIPSVFFMDSRSQYAPEMKSCLVCIPNNQKKIPL